MDRRRFTRESFLSSIDYYVRGNGERVHKGITINCSEEGLCLYVFSPVKKGDSLEILKGDLSLPCRELEVRWVKPLGKEIFKVGLLCMKA